MKKLLPLIIIILSTIQSKSQNLDWAKSIGFDNATISCKSSSFDSVGNLYIMGEFTGTVDFDPGIGIFNISTVAKNVYVLKLDSNGVFVWAKSFKSNSACSGNDIVTDKFGNIYITGSSSGIVDFDPGPGVFNLSFSLGVFLTKLDSNGNFIWAYSIGTYSKGLSICTDTSGNIYTSGTYNGTGDFDPGTSVLNFTSIAGQNSMYIQKFDINGNLVFAKSIDVIGDASEIKVDIHRNIFLAGRFFNTGDFDPGLGIFNLTSAGINQFDIFVEKLDFNGNFIWAKSMGGTNYDYATSLAIDSEENCYVTGAFQGTANFHINGGTTSLTSVAGSPDIFVVKLNNLGNTLWAKSFGGSSTEFGNGVVLFNSTKICVTGRYEGIVDFDPGVGVVNETSAGFYDSFILGLDSSGNLSNVFSTGNLGGDQGLGITTNSSSLVITGSFQGTVDFDPGADTVSLTSTPNDISGFIQKFNFCDYPTYDTIDVVGCFSYVSPSGKILTTGGIYQDTTTNFFNCDSIITINLSLLNSYNNTIHYVTNHLDDGCGTLRDFIREATSGDTIVIATDSILQINSIINTSKDLTIIGKPTISKINASLSNGILNLTGNNLIISYLSFENCTNTYGSGAIQFTGTNLSLVNCNFINNAKAIYQFSAGNININSCSFFNNNLPLYLVGNTNIINSVFQSNNSQNRDGGVIKNSGNLNIMHSVFKDNHCYGSGTTKGGAIYNSGFIKMWYTDFINNLSGQLYTGSYQLAYGGAIYNDNSLEIRYCNFISNSSKSSYSLNSSTWALGGAIYNNGPARIYSSSFVQNKVTANYNANLTNNSYASGGAIYNTDSLELNNSTFYRNTVFASANSSIYGNAYYYGSCISGGNSLILNSTLIENSYSPIVGNVTMGNSLLSNLSTDIGSFTSLGYNVISKGDTNFLAPYDTLGLAVTPLIVGYDTLGFFGGLTYNVSLLNNSLAINKGYPLAPSTDQRNYSRNGLADAGAHEFNGVNNCISIIDSIVIKNTSCFNSNDGQIQIYLQPSSPQFQLIWNNGTTDLSLINLYNGNYSYILYDSTGCVFKDTLTIYQPNQVITITLNDTICQGDSMLIYGVYQNTSGIYYDSLQTINGCDSILSTTLSVNPVYSYSQNVSICQGDSLLLYGSYQNTAGIYYDSLQTINGCDSILSTILILNSLPSVSIDDFLLDSICGNSGLVGLPIGSPSGGSYSGNGVIGGNFDPASAGIGTHDIIYTYTDGNSCINSDTTIITVQLCTGIDNFGNDFGILIYPNPSTGQFTIEKPSDLNKEVQVKLLDVTSNLILEKVIPADQQKVEMDIRNYSKGIYYLQLIVNDEIFVKQVLKN